MDGKLRNMTAVYILCKSKILLLYRQGGRVVNNVWVASAGGHFEDYYFSLKLKMRRSLI